VKVIAGGETPEKMSFGGGSLLADVMTPASQ
jgi:hypothetical protein